MSDVYEEYLRYCNEEKEKFDKIEEQRLQRICFETAIDFSLSEGFQSAPEILVEYTQKGQIKWTYSRNASYYDEEDKTFAIVFVSNTLCIMEIRGEKRKRKIHYRGYLKRNESDNYIAFSQWKDIYAVIIEKSDYFTVKNLLEKLKYKSKRLSEKSWRRVINICYDEAIDVEKKIREYLKRQEYIPISYKRYLYVIKYPENWESFGMSGGAFSPR